MVEFREAPVDNEGVSPHKHRLADYLRPKTLSMLLLGFSSGLPFLLVGNTFGYWLRDEHTSLTAIGFLSWVGIAYSLKFLWAPLMDRVDLPLFKRLGHRRGWMMFRRSSSGWRCARWAECTKAGLGRLGAFALVVAFASSTQDIVVDAWRIEWHDGEEQGLLSSAYQFSSRSRYWLRIPLSSSWQRPGLAHVLRDLRRMDGRWNDRDLVCEGTGARRCRDGRKRARSAALDAARSLRRRCGTVHRFLPRTWWLAL